MLTRFQVPRPLLAALLAAGLLAPRALALSVTDVVSRVSESGYQAFHRGLYVSSGMNRGFSAGNPVRYPTNQHDLARDGIASNFAALGLVTHLHPFGFSKTYSLTYTYTNCRNVIALKPGTDTNAGYYLIGAHYDSVDTGHGSLVNSPGADDNASGVAAVLEAARALAPFSFKSSILFAAFDAEEKGLQGSAAFIRDCTTASSNADNGQITNIYLGAIRSMHSLDMIAYNPAGANSNRCTLYGGSPSSSPAKTNLMQAAVAYGGLIPNDGGQNTSSDHTSFYSATPSVDSACLIEYSWSSNPNYHSASDSVDSPGYIDYAFATRMTRAVAGYLAREAALVPTVTLAPLDTSASEWGPDPASVRVARGTETNDDLVVYYTLSGSASNIDDYAELSGLVMIPTGSSNATVTLSPLSDALAEGDETVTLTLRPHKTYGLGTPRDASITLHDAPIDGWRHAYFTADELTNTAISGEGADPDADGAQSLIEYALDRHPRLSGTGALFAATLNTATSPPCYAIVYERRTNLVDATCAAIFSTNLLEPLWLGGPGRVQEEVLMITGSVERVRATVVSPTADETGRMFLRLQVTRP